jgi:hypothetical protein
LLLQAVINILPKKLIIMVLKHGVIPIGIVLLIVVLISACQDQYPEKVSPVQNFSQLQALFANPPADYRSAPLWDWNLRISREGIDLHLEKFKEAGIGGVFVHPRPGLITEYLSEEWFKLFDYTVQKGKELGMKVWIYDENSYPSGFAGGHVPAEMPESWNQGSGLKFKIQEVFQPEGEAYEVVLKQEGDQFINITENQSQEIGKEGVFYLYSKTFPQTSYWYGGFTYVDLLLPGVTEKFLDVTMTRGYEILNVSDFGQTVKGVFTDEPNLEAAMDRGKTVFRWTPDLWDAFEERWGYDLRVHLPSLVEETGNWKKVRHDYYELVLELFIDRWAIPWYAYCEEKNLDWTGHYWEHGWPYPTHGFDEAAFYIWHQQPGIDMLGGKMVEGGLGGQFGNTRAVRELASAANQGGHLRTLSETYGGGGWEMSFATYKQLADWQAVLGVNFVNQHLSYYSLRGVRKFDYPPSFSYHEPWWENYRLLGDYIGRLSLAGSSGEQINDILVLQPNTTAWMYFSRRVYNPQIDTIQRRFKSFVWQLERNHFEYDLGSEHVMKTLGSVRGNRLRVGKREYAKVLLPSSLENLDSTTYVLMEKFLAGGGEILSFAADIPYLDGTSSKAVNQLLKSYPDQCFFVKEVSDPQVQKLKSGNEFVIREPASGQGELYHQRRLLDDGQLLLLVNSSADQPALAQLEASGKSVLYMDLVSGEISQIGAEIQGDRVSFTSQLPACGSALYFISDKKSSLPYKHLQEGEGKALTSLGQMQIKAEQENVLVLNYLDLESGDLVLKDSYFMDALLALFESHGLEMGNPWQHKIQYRKSYLERDKFPDNSGFSASYHFSIANEIDPLIMKGIRAVVEGHELWEVVINGQPVQKEEDAFWIDREFYYFPVGPHLKTGKNTLTLRAPNMSIFAELMPVYLTGSFLVNPLERGFEISGGTLASTGSWKEQGYPFYSQKVSYTQEFNLEDPEGAYAVRLREWNGTTAEVYVNGEKAGQIGWDPFELQVGNLLKAGDNQVTVKVVGSLKNTFGQATPGSAIPRIRRRTQRRL